MVDIADIKASVLNKTLIQDAFFKNANFLKDARGRLISYTGGYTVVIPAIVNGEKWAFRCWHVPVKDSKKRYSLIGKVIRKSKMPFFCSFDYKEKGLLVRGEPQPITKMKWVEGRDLKKYICTFYQDGAKMEKLALNFLGMISKLHASGIAHGDLQHGNILVTDSGELCLVDYDSMYVPEMGNMCPDIISGLIDYQHPARKNNQFSSEKLDYFSEVIIYTSILAISKNPDLIKKYNVEDSEALLFNSKDFESITHSQVYKELKELNVDDINNCLDILVNYLSLNDINLLEPIESSLMSINIDHPNVVPIGEDFTIKWKSKGAENIEILKSGSVELNGYKKFNLSDDSNIIFVLTSKTGYKKSHTISIKVAERAVINQFKADKEFTLDSVPVKISWNCSNAKEVEILGYGLQSSSGYLIAYPKEETTYTLRVVDDFGIQKKDITIKKLPLPIIKQLWIPTPNINNNIGIIYKSKKFNILVSTPTVNTVLSKINIPKIPTLKESKYYVDIIASNNKNKTKNIFKSIFSFFYKK